MLLILAEKPAHGYGLLVRLSSLPAAPNADRGHLYRTLRHLEQQGLVTSTWEMPQAGPARHTYTLTADGLLALDAWGVHIRAALTRLEGFLAHREVLRGGHRADGERSHDRGLIVQPMKAFDLTTTPHAPLTSPNPGARAAVLLDRGQAKVRRIELDAGGAIPPCQMSDDVVFVMLRGAVMVTSGADEELVAAPGAVYIPGGATTRSLRALEPSLVLAVLCKGAPGHPPAASA